MKNGNFWTFWTFCFYNLERRFFVLEYSKRHFPGLYCLKKLNWKNGHFWTETMVSPLCKNVNFSTLWTSCFYSLERRFLVLKFLKRHFPGLYFIKKSWKNGHLWTKNHGLTLWKNGNFWTFLSSCFYSIERRFFVLEYRKRHFSGLYCLKKKSWKNGHFWTKTIG